MTTKRFRIKAYTSADTTFYDTQVKTWLGWVSFSVFYKTEVLHILSDPSARKAMAFDRIYQYCQANGYKKEDVVISEININKPKRWIFFQRIYLNK
jgi:hypothetical protein